MKIEAVVKMVWELEELGTIQSDEDRELFEQTPVETLKDYLLEDLESDWKHEITSIEIMSLERG